MAPTFVAVAGTPVVTVFMVVVLFLGIRSKLAIYSPTLVMAVLSAPDIVLIAPPIAFKGVNIGFSIAAIPPRASKPPESTPIATTISLIGPGALLKSFAKVVAHAAAVFNAGTKMGNMVFPTAISIP
jgi:hypothetical protein